MINILEKVYKGLQNASNEDNVQYIFISFLTHNNFVHFFFCIRKDNNLICIHEVAFRTPSENNREAYTDLM